MPVVILAAYLIGACGTWSEGWTPAVFRQVADRAESVVEERERADEVARLVSELKRNVAGFGKDFDRASGKLNRVFKSHSAPAAEMTAVLEDLDTSWAASQRRATELRFLLKEVMREDEWSALFGASPEPESEQDVGAGEPESESPPE